MTTTLDRPQHMAALDKASRHRSARAALKRQLFEIPSTLESREACAVLLLEDQPAERFTMRVVDLIAACRGTGPKRARVMMRRAGVSETKILGHLTVDQALAIRGQLQTTHDQLGLL